MIAGYAPSGTGKQEGKRPTVQPYQSLQQTGRAIGGFSGLGGRVTEEAVQVLAIVPKSEADAWLAKHGESDETSSSV